MTTELEEQFFKVFGIEPKHNDGCKLTDNYFNNENLQKQYKTFDEYLNINCTEGDSGLCYSTCDFAYDDLNYPEITDRKLLELICILNSTNGINCTAYESKNIGNLKIEILYECISISDDIELKTKIQQLFKEGE